MIIEDTFLYETSDWSMTWNKIGGCYPKFSGALVLLMYYDDGWLSREFSAKASIGVTQILASR